MDKFNLFRLNCLLNAGQTNNLNNIIISLINEMFYGSKNKELSLDEIFTYLNEYVQIRVDHDYLKKMIFNKKDKFYLITPLKEDFLVKLSPEKFKEIDDKITKHSIEYHIKKFCQSKNNNGNKKDECEKSVEKNIKGLLYQSIYENINSFAINNIKTIIPEDVDKKYDKKAISVFNEFLELVDKDKNSSLYNVFLKAIEFAIITSGKGVKEFRQNIYKNKKYVLDSNILFRLLGIGGSDRKDSLINLFDICKHEGVEFIITSATYNEFRNKINVSIDFLQKSASQEDTKVLQDLIKEENVLYNDGFIIDYTAKRKDGIVKSPDQYKQYLFKDFELLKKKYKIKFSNEKLSATLNKISRLTNELYNSKRELRPYIKYSKKAAEVDALNILYVQELRGSNNFNFSEIKVFYLTKDKTLNSILAKKQKEQRQQNSIIETILPTQLYVLHNSFFNPKNKNDYSIFIKFIKKRTTEFKYYGEEILTLIDEIRQYSVEPENIKDILRAYSDIKLIESFDDFKFDEVLNNNNNNNGKDKIESIGDFTKKYLEDELNRVKKGDDKFKVMCKNAREELPVILKKAKYRTRYLDITITIMIIPLVIFFTKIYSDNIILIIVLSVIVQTMKYLLSSKFNFLKTNWQTNYIKKVKKMSFYIVSNSDDDDFMEYALELMNSEDASEWKLNIVA